MRAGPSSSRPPALLTVAEAASALRVSPLTLRRRIARGEVPAYRVGARGAVRLEANAVRGLLRPYRAGRGDVG